MSPLGATAHERSPPAKQRRVEPRLDEHDVRAAQKRVRDLTTTSAAAVLAIDQVAAELNVSHAQVYALVRLTTPWSRSRSAAKASGGSSTAGSRSTSSGSTPRPRHASPATLPDEPDTASDPVD